MAHYDLVNRFHLDYEIWTWLDSLPSVCARSYLDRVLVRRADTDFTGNKWWGFLKYRVRDFTTKYNRHLNLDRSKVAKSLEDKLSQATEEGDFPAIDLARWDLERVASKCYKRYVVRSRLKRVPKEAIKFNVSAHEEEVQSFPSQYIKSVKSLNERMIGSNCDMCNTFWAHFHNHFACCCDLPVHLF